MSADVFCTPLPARLLLAAAGLEAAGFVVLLARRKRFSAWPLVFLLPGGVAGIWYAALARDLILGAVQALVLLACLRPFFGRSDGNKERMHD